MLRIKITINIEMSFFVRTNMKLYDSGIMKLWGIWMGFWRPLSRFLKRQRGDPHPNLSHGARELMETEMTLLLGCVGFFTLYMRERAG